jgi:hypothetical protein
MTRKAWNGGSIERAMELARERQRKLIAQGATLCGECQGEGGSVANGVCIECRGAGVIVPPEGLTPPMSIPAELRNARMMVNRGHGDVSDEPDPLHEAAADEIERLDRELEAREKTIERLRQELEVLRLIYPEGTADKITFLELDNKRLRTLLRRARQALRSLDEISDEEIGALVCKLDTGIQTHAPCGHCGGSGVIGRRVTVYEHGCGFPHDDTEESPCPKCDGTGVAC